MKIQQMRLIIKIVAVLVLLSWVNQLNAGSFASFQTSNTTPVLPSGVTLKAIDGETLTSSTTMSNNYYTRNSYTGASVMNWDSPSFFSIGTFLCDYDASIVPSSITNFNTLGWNTIQTWAHLNTASVTANNVSAVGSFQSGTLSSPNLVGVNTFDEPSTFAQGVSTPISGLANATQDTIFWQINNTINFANGSSLSGDPAPHTPTGNLAALVATPTGGNRHIDLQSIDIYWFAGSRDANWTPFMGPLGKTFYGLGSNITADQAQRGSNYGDVIDRLRSFQASGTPAPLGVYLETGDPFWNQPSSISTNADVILPSEYNWAAWSQIIHGARLLYIFDHFGPTTGTGTTADNVLDTRNTFFHTIQSGSSVSMQTQVAATSALIISLAPIINAPFAISYAGASPSGYTFPTAHLVLPAAGSPQVDVMTKWYQGGSFSNTVGGGPTNFPNGFYIFATTRASETDTNISATFTVANGSVATVVGESRTIAISGGTFTDTFANAWTVHIYQIS